MPDASKQSSLHLYLIALGSNQRHQLLGSPQNIITHAIAALETTEIDVFAVSSIIASAPLGPSKRSYANAAALLVSSLEPDGLLSQLQMVEEHFGRRDMGQKWRARRLDLDIILWSGGMWSSDSPALNIPHPEMRKRDFVLAPASQIAPQMQDPITGLTLNQLYYRLLHGKAA